MSSRTLIWRRSSRPDASTRRELSSDSNARAAPWRPSPATPTGQPGSSAPWTPYGAGWRSSTRDGSPTSAGVATPTSWCGFQAAATSGTGPTRWWTPSSRPCRRPMQCSRSPSIRGSSRRSKASLRFECTSNSAATKNGRASGSRTSPPSSAPSGDTSTSTAPRLRTPTRSRSSCVHAATGTASVRHSGGRTTISRWSRTPPGTSAGGLKHGGSRP